MFIVKYGVISLILCISIRLWLVTILTLLMKYLFIFHADSCDKIILTIMLKLLVFFIGAQLSVAVHDFKQELTVDPNDPSFVKKDHETRTDKQIHRNCKTISHRLPLFLNCTSQFNMQRGFVLFSNNTANFTHSKVV